jgi:hypothetical protein
MFVRLEACLTLYGFLLVQLPEVAMVFSFHGHIVGGCILLFVNYTYDMP